MRVAVILIQQRPVHADDPPVAVPTCVASLAAPAPAIGEDDAVGHLEDATRRHIARVPRALRAVLQRVDRDRVDLAHEAREVEVVDRHVQDKRAGHLIAEATEVRAQVEVTVHRRQIAEIAGADRAPADVMLAVPSAGLARHEHLPGRFGCRDHAARLVHAASHRLLADDVTPRLKRRAGDLAVRFRHSEIHDEVGVVLVEHRPHIRRGLGIDLVLLELALRALDVEIDHREHVDFLIL